MKFLPDCIAPVSYTHLDVYKRQMQEEVENRTLTRVVSGTKFTGRLLKAASSKYLAHRKEKKLQKQRSRDAPVKPQGKQTVKQLIGQNQGAVSYTHLDVYKRQAQLHL